MIVLRGGASPRHLLPPPRSLALQLFIIIILCALPAAMSSSDSEFMTGDFDYHQLSDLTTASVSETPKIMDSPDGAARMEDNGRPPILTQGPSDSYVIRNRPATLTCRALNSRRIRFKCNGKWIDQTRQVNKEGTDPLTGLAYFESSIPVHRQEVEGYIGFDGFQCECYASSGEGSQAVKSDSAVVKTAYLRKHFYTAPTNDRVTLGRQIQMPCLPPDGDPKPEIFWLKDGREIEQGADSNVILANDGSLIISAARISDSGNYSCEARNVANRRKTDPAQMTVYVNGGWSAWSAWTGSCDIDCDLLKQRMRLFKESGRHMADALPKLTKSRTCTSPAPLNGGERCFGPDLEHKDCRTTCPVDGSWTDWSEWSQCSAECHKFRTRDCADPLPTNGGQHCIGRDLETRNCSGGYCKKGGVGPNGSSDVLGFETSIAMYAGLGCALLLFLMIIALILWLVCRRRRCGSRQKEQDIYYPHNSGHLRTVLMQQPDLAQNALLAHTDDLMKTGYSPAHTTPVPPPPHMSSFSLRSGKSSGSGYSSSRPGKTRGGFIGSRAALIAESSSNGSSSADKTANRSASRSSHNSDENYATLYEFDTVEDEERQNRRNSVLSVAFPQGVSADAVAVGRVSESGGRVALPHCAVSLTVPEGALDSRASEEIFVAVSRDPADRPRLADGETLLSPVIWAGPPGLPFRKPVIVSFQHCAKLFPKDYWQVTLYINEGSPGDATVWEPAVRLGDETLNTPMYCQMDLDSCHVLTESLCRMALVGRTRRSQPNAAVKRAKLVAFAPLYPSTLDYSVRVYCVEDTCAALQSVMAEEEHMGGYMVTDTRDFFVVESGDLCFCLEDVSPGWRVKPGANYQEIPAAHAWSGMAGLHCSFSLELSNGERLNDNLSARIVVYQKGCADGRQILQINTAVASRSSVPRSDSMQQTVVNAVSDYSSAAATPRVQVATARCFKLPAQTKRTLCACLDPPTEGQNDWRMLARTLGVDRYIPYFATRTSPTEHILDLWEAREAGSSVAIIQLLQMLHAMGRQDAALVLDAYLQQQPVDL